METSSKKMYKWLVNYVVPMASKLTYDVPMASKLTYKARPF